MIKKYNQYIKESLLDKLEGPSEEEVWNSIKYKGINKALIISCEKNFLYGVKKALSSGADYKTEYNKPFRTACEHNSYSVVKYLLDNFKIHDATLENSYWNSVAKRHKKIYNLIKKYITIEESLLDKLEGPSKEEIWDSIKDLEPNEILLRSAEIGLLDGVKYAIDNGATLDKETEKVSSYSNRALYYASANDNLEIIKYLNEMGCGLHFNYDYIFRIAAKNGYLDIVKYLLDNGADTNHLSTSDLRYINNNHPYVYNYLSIKESLLDKLEGPSREDVLIGLNELTPNNSLIKSIELDLLDGVKDAIRRGAELDKMHTYELPCDDGVAMTVLNSLDLMIKTDREEIFDYVINHMRYKPFEYDVFVRCIRDNNLKYTKKFLDLKFSVLNLPSDLLYLLKHQNKIEMINLLTSYYKKENDK